LPSRPGWPPCRRPEESFPRLRVARRIGARRLGAVARAATQPPLQLRDPLILAGNPSGQGLDLRLQPLVLSRQRQQNPDDRVTAPFVDRLRLNPLHTPEFDTPELCPPDQLNVMKEDLQAPVTMGVW
jgi:hypothetical protein